MKLVPYLRRSSKSQQDNSSADNQWAEIQRYCSVYGHELICEPFDEVKSAADNSERKQFDAAIEYMEDNEADGLIIYDIDRFSRSVIDGLTTFKRYFSVGSYTLVSVNQRIDTSTDDGWFMLTIFLATAELERRRIARRTQSGKAYLKSQGFVTEGDAGFIYDIEEKVVDGKVRRVAVRNIDRVYIHNYIVIQRNAGATYESIADELNRAGHKAKRGGRFTRTQVQRIYKGAE